MLNARELKTACIKCSRMCSECELKQNIEDCHYVSEIAFEEGFSVFPFHWTISQINELNEIIGVKGKLEKVDTIDKLTYDNCCNDNLDNLPIDILVRMRNYIQSKIESIIDNSK